MKPRIKEVIVVEGRYDANTLHQIVDAVIVTTDGFGVFHDKQKLSFLRRLAAQRGLIVFTDSDGAGFVIRNHLKGAIPAGQLKHAYVPDVYGKEKRKKTGGKEGKIGVEGMTPDILLNALRRSGATFECADTSPDTVAVTKADLLEFGLIGANSTEKRNMLIRHLSLPEHITPNALLDALNLLCNRDELEKWCKNQ